jgi:lyso-ornithine lipid O-acyltransferase
MGVRSFLRGSRRASLLIFSLLEVRLRFFGIYLRSKGRISQGERAAWLHASCACILRRLGIRLDVYGNPANDGLIVSNHLSYLDILLYGAIGNFVFVSKSEVRRWPLFGALARHGGTVFVERNRSLQTADASRQIASTLADGIPIVLFPEGTSSDGSSVLPFRSPLFEPATRIGAKVSPAAIRYSSSESPESEIAYWGEMVFGPHLFRTLSLGDLATEIRFGDSRIFDDRKTAASMTRNDVLMLRTSDSIEGAPVDDHVQGYRRAVATSST